MEAIGKATRDAYGKLEEALGAVTEACKPALWPGVYWDVMPGDEGGFRVHQYYIGRDGADKTKAGKPTHVGSVYSGLLPDWYKKNNWMGHKGGKSKARIALRACELYGEDESLAPEARKFLKDAKDRILEKGKRFDFESRRFETIVRQAGGDSDDAREILGLMRQREYSIPNYSKAEKERVKGRKRKMNSSMPPTSSLPRRIPHEDLDKQDEGDDERGRPSELLGCPRCLWDPCMRYRPDEGGSEIRILRYAPGKEPERLDPGDEMGRQEEDK